MLRLLLVALACTALSTPVLSQTTPAQPSQKDTSKIPPAPPATTGTTPISADCVSFKPPEYTTIQIGKVSAVVTGEVHLKIERTSDKGPLVVSCDRSAQTVQGVATPIDFTGVGPRVWTAAESQQQMDFLREEVKSAINEAVNNKLVANETIQAAATKALADNTAFRNAVLAIIAQEEDKIAETVAQKLKQAQPANTPPQKN